MTAKALTVLVGPAGVGKGTVVKALMQLYPQVKVSVSATTRPPRPGEEDGIAYFFVDDAQFDRMVEQNELLEWATVHRKYRYGTPKGPVVEQLQQGTPVLLEIDLDGARQVKRAMPECVSIFLAPPSWEELERRLRGRGTETAEEVARRLQTARVELAAQSEFNHVIVNDDLHKTVEELACLMQLR